MNLFARDYKIEIAADNSDSVFWNMFRKGEHKSPTDEDKQLMVKMLRKVLSMIARSLGGQPEVYLCVLTHDDGTFKQIVGCFYDYDRAVKYAGGSPRITIHKQTVI